MTSENENDPSQSRFAWRPATRADIGSVARFRLNGTTGRRERDWSYGILKSISRITPFEYRGPYLYGVDLWDVCEIQYDPNEEP